MTDSEGAEGPVPLGADVPEQCGRVWGWHREHWCEEPEGHAMQHFCECDAEIDEDTIVAMEAEGV